MSHEEFERAYTLLDEALADMGVYNREHKDNDASWFKDNAQKIRDAMDLSERVIILIVQGKHCE